MTVADVGAGFGAMTVVLAKWLGPSGRVFATDITPDALAAIREAATGEHLDNVTIVKGAAAATNLPDACCDAIFMRDVYHHITEPEAFDRSLLRALRAGGRLAIIDFEPRPGSPLPDGVRANRGGHGITPPIIVGEVTSVGLAHVTTIATWPPGDRPGGFFLVLFRRP